MWGCSTEDKQLYKVATGGINPNKLIKTIKTIDNFNKDASIVSTQTHRVIGGKIIIDIEKKISQLTLK